MFSSPEKQDKIIAILDEIRKWTKLQGTKTLKEVINQNVNDDRKRLIFHLSDGKSTREVGVIAGVHHSTVNDYWKLWAAVGLMESHPSFKGRYYRIFSLEDVGIEPPEVLKVQQEKNEPKEPQKETPKGLEVFTEDSTKVES